MGKAEKQTIIETSGLDDYLTTETTLQELIKTIQCKVKRKVKKIMPSFSALRVSCETLQWDRLDPLEGPVLIQGPYV